MTSRRAYNWLLMIPVLLYAAWLGARGFNADAIWLDEYYSIYESGGAFYGPLSPSEMMTRIISNSVWPPSYNIVLATWGAFAGWEPLAGRALFWVVGLLAIAVQFRLGRQLFPRTPLVALGAAVFLAGSAFYIYYLHELRGYTLHVLLGCGTMSLYWSLLHSTTRLRLKQVGFTITAILLLYSHPVGQLWFAVLAGFHILFAHHSPFWNRILFLFFVAGAAYMPWVGVMLVRMQLEVEMPRGQDPLIILQAAGVTFANQIPVIVGVLCILTLRHLRQKPLQFLWLLLTGLIASVLVVDRFVSFLFHIRHLIAVLPIMMILAAVGLAEFRRIRWIPAIALGGWLVLGAYLSFNHDYLHDLPGAAPVMPNPGFETAHRFVNAHAVPSDAVLFQFADNNGEFLMSVPLEYYFHDSPLQVSFLSMVNADEQIPSFPERLHGFVNNALYIWTVEIEGYLSSSNTLTLETLLAERYSDCGTLMEMPDIKIQLYANAASADCQARMATISSQP